MTRLFRWLCEFSGITRCRSLPSLFLPMPLLIINGDSKDVASTSIEGLLSELMLPVPLILVEHNGCALHRSEWHSVTLAEGDRLELMQVAAGG